MVITSASHAEGREFDPRPDLIESNFLQCPFLKFILLLILELMMSTGLVV